MMSIVKAMNDGAQIRIPWHRLSTILLALAVLVAPVSPVLCAPGDCSGKKVKTEAGCGGMAMPQSAVAMSGQSDLGCCQIDPVPPATTRSSTDTDKAKTEFALVSLGMGLPSLVTARRPVARPLDSAPPHDVQNLFCTLLI